MMKWDDVRLVAVLFHELAHQVLYVKGDTAFNESFATAVEEAGVRRWLVSRGNAGAFEHYNDNRAYRAALMDAVRNTRVALRDIYAMQIPDDEKRARKKAQFERLRAAASDIADRHGRTPPAWLTEQPNNARLAAMALYGGRLPEFRELLQQCNDDLPCFYQKSRELAASHPRD